MKAVIQRVKKAQVKVVDRIVGQIGLGFLVFVGIGENDTEKEVDYLAKKIANLRIMADKNDKMNLTLKEVGGKILAVSQFTLYGDTKGQNRPSFIAAAKPELAKKLFDLFIEKLKSLKIPVETGIFGAKMEVELINDGPVTIIIDSQN